MPIDININIINPSEQLQNSELPNPDIDLIEKGRAVVNADIMKNIRKAQNKQSKYYDKKHGAGSSFVVGAPVLKKNFLRKKNVAEAWTFDGRVHSKFPNL